MAVMSKGSSPSRAATIYADKGHSLFTLQKVLQSRQPSLMAGN